ncbi:hypothetical protein BDZ97DRAFT_505399 [Flammula alnicola]|nr:hypothetical protein BDZ97DRAFT_505399 [Flammula alnicola]
MADHSGRLPGPYPPSYNSEARDRTGGPSSYHPKMTGYRILVIFLTAGFGLSKAKLSYQGKSTAPNTLDWMYGVVAFLILYWLGIYERHSMHNMRLMFEVDYLAGLWKLIAVFWRLIVRIITGRDSNRPTPSRRSTRED